MAAGPAYKKLRGLGRSCPGWPERCPGAATHPLAHAALDCDGEVAGLAARGRPAARHALWRAAAAGAGAVAAGLVAAAHLLLLQGGACSRGRLWVWTTCEGGEEGDGAVAGGTTNGPKWAAPRWHLRLCILLLALLRNQVIQALVQGSLGGHGCCFCLGLANRRRRPAESCSGGVGQGRGRRKGRPGFNGLPPCQ